MRHSKRVHGHRLIKIPEIQIPENLKLRLEIQAKSLIDTILKPAYVILPPENSAIIYIADIYSKWQDHYFYFCAEYCRVSSNNKQPTSSSWESKFARLDYVGDIRFNLSYVSAKGNWEKIFIDLTVDECMDAIENESFFFPSPPDDWQLTFA